MANESDEKGNHRRHPAIIAASIAAALGVVGTIVGALLTHVLGGSPQPEQSTTTFSTRAQKAEGRYDVRQAASGFAPIVGALGALAVPAIIVLFTVPARPSPYRAPFISLAAGLLIVSVVGSFIGSLGLASVGAEQDQTANLVPAIMFLLVPVMISVVAILAAFEVLAAIYLPESKTLFALIAGAAGLVGSLYIALGVSDTWHAGPSEETLRVHWLSTQWIQSHAQAYRTTQLVIAVSSLPALIGMLLRLIGVDATPTTVSANVLVAIAFALTISGAVAGVLRSRHPVDGPQKGLRPYEVLSATLGINCYVLSLMILLP